MGVGVHMTQISHNETLLYLLEELTVVGIGKDVERLELSHRASWRRKWHSYCGECFGVLFLKKLITEVP